MNSRSLKRMWMLVAAGALALAACGCVPASDTLASAAAGESLTTFATDLLRHLLAAWLL